MGSTLTQFDWGQGTVAVRWLNWAPTRVSDLLKAQGVNSGWQFSEAYAMSADGGVVVVRGFIQGTTSEGFVIVRLN